MNGGHDEPRGELAEQGYRDAPVAVAVPREATVEPVGEGHLAAEPRVPEAFILCQPCGVGRPDRRGRDLTRESTGLDGVPNPLADERRGLRPTVAGQ